MANPLSVITKPLSAITSRDMAESERAKCAPSGIVESGLETLWRIDFEHQIR